MHPRPRITIHDLTGVERQFLGALFTRAGGVSDREFAIAATACAAARGIHADVAVAITTAGLVVELAPPDEAPRG